MLGKIESPSTSIAAFDLPCLKMSVYDHVCADPPCSNHLFWRRGKMAHFTSSFWEGVNSQRAQGDWLTVLSLFVGEPVWLVTQAVWVKCFAEKKTRNTHTHSHTQQPNKSHLGAYYCDFIPTSYSITWCSELNVHCVFYNFWQFHPFLKYSCCVCVIVSASQTLQKR